MDRKATSVAVDARPGIVDVMLRWICCGVAMMLSLLSAKPAHAVSDTLHTTWICWHDGATTLACQLSQEAQTGSGDAADDEANTSAGLLPAGAHPLPQLARTILEQPEQLQGRRISIPMFSEPEEQDFMMQLAEAVMCGIRSGCHVEFLRTVSEVALLQDALNDPAIN